MTNNYTQFSVLLPLPDGDNNRQMVDEWYHSKLAEYDRWFDEELEKGTEDYEENPLDGFDWKLSDGCVWVYAGECGDVEKAAVFIQKYLVDMGIDGGILMTWANTCSKMRVNEFDGGAAVITKDNIHWQTTNTLVEYATKQGVAVLNHDF